MNTTEYQQLVQFLTSQFAGIDRRFDGLREELHSLRRETQGHFAEIYRRLERLEQEYQAIVQGLRRIESLMTEEAGRREHLERRLEDLRQQVAGLQLRIDELEQRLRPSPRIVTNEHRSYNRAGGSGGGGCAPQARIFWGDSSKRKTRISWRARVAQRNATQRGLGSAPPAPAATRPPRAPLRS